jgi:O-antigen ligase
MSLESCFVLFLFSGRFKAMPELQSIPVDVTALFFVATLCLLGRAIVSNQMRPPSATMPVVLMIVFSELAAISLFWSSITWLNVDKVARFLLFTSPSYFMAWMIVQDPIRRARLVRMIACVSFAILSYYAFYRYALGIDMEQGASVNSAAVPTKINNYLEYAEHASMLFIILLVSGVLGSARQLLAAVLGMGAALFLLLSLGGRGPLIFALFAIPSLALVLLMRLRPWRRRLVRLTILIVGVVCFAVAAYMAAEQSGLTSTEIGGSFRTLERIQMQLAQEDTNSLDKRSEGREFAVQQWFVKPILGWGIGEFRVFDNELKYPHNLLLEILMEMGIVGAALFFSICMLSLRACVRIAGDSTTSWIEITIALLFAIDLISRFTVQGYLADDRIFFAFAGMAIGASVRPALRAAGRSQSSRRPKPTGPAQPHMTMLRAPIEPEAETP